MKKLFLSILVLSLPLLSNAQKVNQENIPAPVMNAFKAMYTNVPKVKWEMDYADYEAEFTNNKMEMSAKYDKDGKWLETETAIKSIALPKAVKECLTKEFGELSAYKFDDCQKVQNAANEISYEMDIIKGELKYEIVISDKGVILKKEEKK